MQRLLMILQIVPALIEIIRTIETMFPAADAGKAKLTLVKDIMTTAHAEITEMWPTIELMVASIVKFANTVGLFKKT